MKIVQAGALALMFTTSYAWSATPEGPLGKAMPTRAGAAAMSAAPARIPAPRLASGRLAARFTKALTSLRPDGRAATRGAAEMRVYEAASPAVVLVLAEDSLGSGALISADGKIITNLHVVGSDKVVGVIFKPKDGLEIDEASVMPARVIKRDEVADLALLQVAAPPAGVKPLVVGSAKDVKVGSDVHAIGHPTGETWTYTRGIVSQIRGDYIWKTEDRIEHKATVIQTQTPINPGNSGGPLIDDDLEIVGINSFLTVGEGLNFAVSGDDVTAFLARKTDRTLAASAKKATKACEAKDLETWRPKEETATAVLMDEDCDGEGDFIVMMPDDKSQPLLVILDEDRDGIVDAVIYDNDWDGRPDLAMFDTDADGKPDLRGEYKPGETEPYRYERIDG